MWRCFIYICCKTWLKHCGGRDKAGFENLSDIEGYGKNGAVLGMVMYDYMDQGDIGGGTEITSMSTTILRVLKLHLDIEINNFQA